VKYFGLIWANLFRKQTRTLLTLLSLVSAFLLFGLLQAVNVLFNSAGDFVGATRLVTQARVSFTQALPLRLLPQIESVDGVEAVMYQQWFGGYYQEPRNFIAMFAVEPQRFLAVYPEWVLAPEQREAFLKNRTGVIVGRQLADRFGWKVGDKVPFSSNIWPQQNGDKTWPLDIVGIFDGKDEDWQRRTNALAYLNFAYFDEARQFGRGGAGTYIVTLADPDRAAEVAREIDRRFENSPDETRTQTEKDFQLGFIKQIGEIGLIVNAILAAVFFTILLLTGNTMAQAVRERIPELAILKTLGFRDVQVMGFVLAEATLLVVIGGLSGMLLASGAMTVLGSLPGFPPFRMDATVWIWALGAMVGLSLAVGILPALTALRLNIADALRR
jgi:putative ABC transport system permease protein